MTRTIARIRFHRVRLGTMGPHWMGSAGGWEYTIRRHRDGRQWTGWADRGVDADAEHIVKIGRTLREAVLGLKREARR